MTANENTKTDTVDITELLQELVEKNNLLSNYCLSLLNKINDLYIRLEINARVIERISEHLQISEEKYLEIVKKVIEEVKSAIDKSDLFNLEKSDVKQEV